MEIYTHIFHTSSQELLKNHIETILAILFDSNLTEVENKASYIETGGFTYSHQHNNVGSAIIKDRGTAIEFAKNWAVKKNEAIKKSLSSFSSDFNFQGAFFPLQYMKLISSVPILNEKNSQEIETWELFYKLELPSIQSEDIKDKASIYNAGIKLKLGTNGNMQGVDYNFLPIERVQKTILNKVLANESDSPELTFILNNETNSITPFYFSSSDLPFIQASNQSFLPSSFLIKNKRRKVAYVRNYEEQIGLTKVPFRSGLTYEDYFINLSPKVKSVVDAFISVLPSNTSTSFSAFEILIIEYGEKLWNAAIDQAKSDPDDRPLYWARIKMQVALKSHPIFKRSGGRRRLKKLIDLFEEKSRNYTGVDFSEADKKGLKKILIAGFDPFFLNSVKYSGWHNILQSNPSGAVILSLHNTETDNGLGFIQGMIVPVRYSDFDSSSSPTTGQGEGIIEKYIKPWIDKVDMIVTISQTIPPFKYNIDKYATATRGGTLDNLEHTRNIPLFGRSIDIKRKPELEWLETTLPPSFLVSPVVLDSSYTDKNQVSSSSSLALPIKVGEQIIKGSGGNYLSNELFYRVAKLRVEIKPSLATGHFHIEKLQDETILEDYKVIKTKPLVKNVKDAINNGVTGL